MPRAPKLAQSIMRAERDRFRAQIEEAHDYIVLNLPAIMEAAVDSAVGLQVEDRSGEEVRVYRKEPNPELIKYLIDRVAGKPTEHLQVEHRAFVVEDFIRESAEKALAERGMAILAPPQEELAPPVETIEGEVRIIS